MVGCGYGCLYMTGYALAICCWLVLPTGAPLFAPLMNTSGGGNRYPVTDVFTTYWYFEVEVFAKSC